MGYVLGEAADPIELVVPDAHPDDPDVDELIAERRKYDRSYLNWGHRCLGWAVWAFRTPVEGHTTAVD